MSSHYQTTTNYIFSTRAGFARFLFCFGFLMLNPTLVYNTEREKIVNVSALDKRGNFLKSKFAYINC